jgi:hypothetical protein
MSTLKADTIVAADGSSPVTLTKQSAARVVGRINGEEATPDLATFSTNASSVVDNATGKYTLNYTNAMADTEYTTMATVFDGGGENDGRNINCSIADGGKYNTTSLVMFCGYVSTTSGDLAKNDCYATMVTMFGDLA